MGDSAIVASIEETTTKFQSGSSGDFTVINGDKTSRVRIMGRVVAKFVNFERTYGNITLDDETGCIKCKFFVSNLYEIKKIQIGDLIEVFGRVNLFNDEIQIITESLGILKNINYELLRKLKIAFPEDKAKTKLIETLSQKKETSLNELIEILGENVTKPLGELLNNGDVYESAPKHYSLV